MAAAYIYKTAPSHDNDDDLHGYIGRYRRQIVRFCDGEVCEQCVCCKYTFMCTIHNTYCIYTRVVESSVPSSIGQLVSRDRNQYLTRRALHIYIMLASILLNSCIYRVPCFGFVSAECANSKSNNLKYVLSVFLMTMDDEVFGQLQVYSIIE